MHRILFICVHNSARSQMAEAFANHYGQGEVQAQSAGLEPGELNPLVVEVMAEKDYDIADNETTSVFELYRSGELYSAVITVCDESSEKKCPIFPGVAYREHWPFEDPAALAGSREEKLARLREIRDEIERRVRDFLEKLPRP